MDAHFPSEEFFARLGERIEAEADRFRRLGAFDVTFALHVLPGGPVDRARLFVLEFDLHSLRRAREIEAGRAPEGVDFVLEAPYAVWREMLLARADPAELGHSVNTLVHHDAPMRVEWADPAGHDKLFRYQESVQLVFDLAAAVEAAAAGSRGGPPLAKPPEGRDDDPTEPGSSA